MRRIVPATRRPSQATSLLTREGTNASLIANALFFKAYRDHFGSLPVEVFGNSP